MYPFNPGNLLIRYGLLNDTAATLSFVRKTSFIKSIVSPGESITIDELIEIKEIQKIPLIALKHSIYDLIEEGIFNGVQGNSRQKIGGKIGTLIRK